MAPALPFSVSLRAGEPVAEQVVFAVKRAVASGQLRADDPFPSVRTLSQQLRINPNTAHRIVTALVDDGLLEVRPGIGTVVSGSTAANRGRPAAFRDDAERLVIEAKAAGLTLQQVLTLVREGWAKASRTRGAEEL